MKAFIICSVHALCDISRIERDACNRACAQHGIPVFLAAKDHARVLATANMLEFLSHLPGSMQQRRSLVECYLDMLNDEIWNASLCAYPSVFAALLGPKSYGRPTGFVSDYPMLTTNLARSAALVTRATKLGHLTTPADPLNIPRFAARLEAAARSLNVACSDIDILVAHQRDFAAAQSLDMHPRFVEELTQPQTRMHTHRCIKVVQNSARSRSNSTPIAHTVAVPA